MGLGQYVSSLAWVSLLIAWRRAATLLHYRSLVTPAELLRRLTRASRNPPPDSATARVIHSFNCAKCGGDSRIVSVKRTQAEFECPSCRGAWAI
jgi:hypothetical protein